MIYSSAVIFDLFTLNRIKDLEILHIPQDCSSRHPAERVLMTYLVLKQGSGNLRELFYSFIKIFLPALV